MFARMMRFYSLGYREILSLPIDIFQQLYEAITVIDAEENLLALNVSAYPHMKKSSQDTLRRRLHKLSRPNIFVDDDKEPSTMAEAAKILAGVLGGRR